MSLEVRLARLERSVRIHRILLSVAGCALLLTVLVAADSRPGGRYVADELIIQDETGRPRIIFSGNHDDAASVRLMDANGVERIRVGSYDNGVAVLSLAGEDAATRVAITTKDMDDAKTKYMDRFGKTIQVYP